MLLILALSFVSQPSLESNSFPVANSVQLLVQRQAIDEEADSSTSSFIWPCSIMLPTANSVTLIVMCPVQHGLTNSAGSNAFA